MLKSFLAAVILSASVERCFVYLMWDFLCTVSTDMTHSHVCSFNQFSNRVYFDSGIGLTIIFPFILAGLLFITVIGTFLYKGDLKVHHLYPGLHLKAFGTLVFGKIETVL